jgi:hypothetical protein
MKQATLDLESPAATTRVLRVTPSATETACAAAPAPAPRSASESLPDDNPEEGATPSGASKAATPAGPRSKATRIVQLARSLGVQSDAEAAGQLGDVPF